MTQTAAVLRAHGTYHDLITLLDQEKARHPEDATLHLRYAALHLEHQDWQSALVSLEQGRRQGVAESELALLQGQSLAQARQWQGAKTSLDTYLSAHPGNLIALIERARVLTQLNLKEAALADYRLALQSHERQQPELFIETAEALASAKHGDEALQVLAAGETKFGPVPQLVQKAIDLELAAERHDLALRRIDRMQQIMPRPEPWMLKRASVLAQAGRFEDAQAAFIQLRGHIANLPLQERSSHAMCLLAEQAGTAISALSPLFSTPPPKAP